jgi:hypothetical protein
MELYIQELFDILKPIKENINNLNSITPTDEIEQKRFDNLKNQNILSIFTVFNISNSSIKFTKFIRNQNLTYSIYWNNRPKYFKINKKEILNFINEVISIIQQSDRIKIVDIRLNKDTMKINLLSETDNFIKT